MTSKPTTPATGGQVNQGYVGSMGSTDSGLGGVENAKTVGDKKEMDIAKQKIVLISCGDLCYNNPTRLQ
jgi:hypothetical protein